MARRNKKPKLADLPAQADPSTELDSATFLSAAQPVLKQLESDLLARAKGSPTVTAALKARHAAEKSRKRTADNFAQWQQNFIDQVAAAWLLSCVFVRTLEDRGLLTHPRIAGPGASDSQKLFFAMAPSLTERDYLLTVFRELTHFDVAQDLFDTKHNPVWLLTPSAEAAKALLALFRSPTADTPAFRFGQPDTRFLGDLYQDLNERVRKRYALLQTPRFVESFILDRTLERAIERFGLEDTTVIDPTCGSGHFLLGSFDRLYEHRLRTEPGLDPRQAAHKALDAVFGADINPYAVAIARFRLTLSFLEKARFKKLADAPELPLHLVVADSLLHNPHLEQIAFADLEDQPIKEWKGEEFALEDEKAARDVLHRQYAAVVGNPPYITVKDKALRDQYRELYPSAFRKYALSVPFTERFFQLGREGAYVGMITANSFMKREFGKKLIEEFLLMVNLDIIINTSGAYIPGHGTPTVLLFGTAEEPKGSDLLGLLASRGEPSTPEDPEQGHVWRSIADHWSDEGFENDYVTVTRVERQSLARHPWVLTGGGAVDVKERLEEACAHTLSDLVSSVGVGTVVGEDEVFSLPPHVAQRLGLIDQNFLCRPLIVGKQVRDWAANSELTTVGAYDERLELKKIEDCPSLFKHLWPYRTHLWDRAVFGGGTYKSAGRPWYEWHQFTRDRYRTPLTITFAEVATHNHFVLDLGGKVFNRTAPIIKLPEDATEDDHFALLAYLNSSTACFWMKQVSHNKGYGADANNARTTARPWEDFFQFAATSLKKLPLPSLETLTEFGRSLDSLATRRRELHPAAILRSTNELSLRDAINTARQEDIELFGKMVALQEELDWKVYELFGLSDLSSTFASTDSLAFGTRPFEQQLAVHGSSEEADAWFARHDMLRPEEEPTTPPTEAKLAAIRRARELRVLEDPNFKRPWEKPQFNRELEKAIVDYCSEILEDSAKERAQPTRGKELFSVMKRSPRAANLAQLIPSFANLEERATEILSGESVPYLSAHRLSEQGMIKLSSWERTWELQRKEDAGEEVGEIPIPPKYSSKDFKATSYWRLRGKLDVPKERFISYPDCESDEDGEPLYGWAGWNHLQRMQALAALYQQRKKEGWRAETEPTADGEKDDRLTPMLAGLLELLPWVKQWHNEPSDEFDGLRLGDYFERFINGECRELGLTHEDLRDWRPADKGRGRKKKRRSKQ